MVEVREELDPRELLQELFKMDKYRERLSQMAVEGSTSLVVDFEDIQVLDEELAKGFIRNPSTYLSYANSAAYEQLKIEAPSYAEKIAEQGVCVRLRNLPTVTRLRDVGSDYIGRLVMLEGIVVRATPVEPMVVEAYFRCRNPDCLHEWSVEPAGMTIRWPSSCPQCKRRNIEFVDEKTRFVDYQRIRIQEKPEDLPPGQLPRVLDVRVVGKDLVDRARPGDRVSVVGIVRAFSPRMTEARMRRVFTVYIDANYIETQTREAETITITPEEEEKIKELAKDPWIHRKIVQSIAPSIYGREEIKEAIMYLLFGGVPKHLPDGYIRGNINVLIIGDPGTGKSRLLQYVAEIAPRGLYTTGRGTTAAGLTAAVMRDERGGMTLEAGALVLADKGVCAIDELEKMRPEDRVSIHEAMAQNTISIAKGGIVATLNARTAILAAANPALGRYDPYRTVAENFSLPVTILSRFDLIFVLRDVPDKDLDAKMSKHILDIHRMAHAPVETPIPPELLRKYISYAKRINPVLTEEAAKRLQEFYLEMRSRSGEGGDSPIAITARQLEALIRIAEARARAALREKVLVEDAEAAIAIMRKSLEQVGMDVATKRMDIDVIMTGKPKSMRDKLTVVLDTIVSLQKKEGFARIDDVIERVREHDVSEAEARRFIGILIRDGVVYEPKPGYLKKT